MKKAIVIITIFILLFNTAGVVHANQIEDITEIVNSKEILEIENIMQDYRNVDSDIYKKDIVDRIFEIKNDAIRKDLLDKLDEIDKEKEDEVDKRLEEKFNELGDELKEEWEKIIAETKFKFRLIIGLITICFIFFIIIAW